MEPPGVTTQEPEEKREGLLRWVGVSKFTEETRLEIGSGDKTSGLSEVTEDRRRWDEGGTEEVRPQGSYEPDRS